MKQDDQRKRPNENFEFSIEGVRVKLGGRSVALIATAIAALLYALVAHRC